MIAAGLDTWQIDLVDVLEDIRVRGYAVVRSYASAEAISSMAASVGYAMGAEWMGLKVLEGDGENAWLPAHTESLILGEPVLACFALGCVEAGAAGGATCLYDGQQAALSLLATCPELRAVRIQYRSHGYPGQQVTHPLITEDSQYGPVLRYRSRTETNTMLEIPPSMTVDEVYETVDRAVSDALTVVHRWRRGDVLIVNNRFMIHARQPYSGHRVMVRCRYDDPNHKSIQLAGIF